MQKRYITLDEDGASPIKMWTKGVFVDDKAKVQLINTAKMPFIYKWLAVMPDVHVGKGSTIGSVIPTINAIIPAAVGVDIGCGMMAIKTSLNASDLPDNLFLIRTAIEAAVPHGRSVYKHTLNNIDEGAWKNIPKNVENAWQELEYEFKLIVEVAPKISKTNNINHLGTLGGGNHFIEICLDENSQIWIMLHSGSRGVGNAIGRYFIELAKKDAKDYIGSLPDKDLAYFSENTKNFNNYIFAVEWAQKFAHVNREIMMSNIIEVLRQTISKKFTTDLAVINCHHNYVTREIHYGNNVFVTRKGAVRAGKGDMGIIPGSMGAESFIVRGLGNQESFCSCSHGAGRIMSRTEAKKLISLDEHITAIQGVECKLDEGLIDETPNAYKDINKVMEAQSDLVEILYKLKQIICIKG
ncbi:RtcB family protein [Rickettsia endosymbiont of Cardiosporidium cionae]|uniref:RtcB family protein n=1 Tax=Rickettsia endosymbiont of Cardiosporidium cionae TaxID=2777155 RepID=UPI00189369D3|nr:RtcB family protein [Rickettsia endosymbiont of Cardiosporidium cionae]KAF8818576.1 RNA-splicing ligase RtcB [Rickettsia endosymbiont of Cardiosporidium cionae]